MRNYLAGGAAVALLMAMGAPASAQEKKYNPAPLPARKAAPPEDSPDPTQPGAKIQERLAPILPGATGGPATAATVFTINVRGRVIVTDQTPAVLLELDPQGAPILVVSGGYFGYGGLKMQLVRVTATEVVIDTGSGKELYLR